MSNTTFADTYFLAYLIVRLVKAGIDLSQLTSEQLARYIMEMRQDFEDGLREVAKQAVEAPVTEAPVAEATNDEVPSETATTETESQDEVPIGMPEPPEVSKQIIQEAANQLGLSFEETARQVWERFKRWPVKMSSVNLIVSTLKG